MRFDKAYNRRPDLNNKKLPPQLQMVTTSGWLNCRLHFSRGRGSLLIRRHGTSGVARGKVAGAEQDTSAALFSATPPISERRWAKVLSAARTEGLRVQG